MSSIFEFDFDDWADLAQRDPLAFDRRRDQVMDEVRANLCGNSNPALFKMVSRSDNHQCCSTFHLRRSARD